MSHHDKDDLKKFSEGFLGEDLPKAWEDFMAYYGPVFQEGALTAREKALIALAVAEAIHCPYCIEAYTRATLEAGCDKEELLEALHVAAAITGGATLAYGVQMKRLADKLEF